MHAPLARAKLVVKKSSISGYGVFAEQNIRRGDLIEECYALMVDHIEPDLTDYYFSVKGQSKKSLFPLGYGCIYNHSDQPNANYLHDPERQIMIFRALRAIQAGDEIFVSYGRHWFSTRTVQQKKPSLRYRFRKLMPLLLRFALVLTGLSLLIIFGSA